MDGGSKLDVRKDLDVIKQFQERIADVPLFDQDERFLLRFLKARNFDQHKAEAMIRKSLKWRQQMGLDYILANYSVPEVIINYVPTAFLGFDKEGCSVRLLPQGPVDFKGLVSSVRKLDLVKSLLVTFEYDLLQMKINNKRTGKNADTFVFILDYEGFSLKQVASKAVMDVVFHLVHIFEANYPERLKTAFVINVPPLFSTLFSAVKPFLAEETKQKFHFLGKDDWKRELLKTIDASVLPVYLGGTRTDSDGDPTCSSIIAPGGIIPQKYYLRNQPRLSEHPDSVEVTLEYKAVHLVEVHVPKPNSLLEWEVEAEDIDIGVGLLYLNKVFISEENKELYPAEEILPTERMSCQSASDVGCYLCEKPGIYILQLDNSYGKFHRKTIAAYRIKISSMSISENVLTSVYSKKTK